MNWTEITAELPGWRIALGSLHLTVKAESFAKASEFVAQVAALAEAADHHPDIDLRYDTAHLALMSHDQDRITDKDVALAKQISAVVDDSQLTLKVPRIQEVEIAIDTLDHTRIIGFWAAVMNYREAGDAVIDPLRIGPPIWFQTMDEPRVQRNRIHLDVSVAHDEAERRIAAAVAAGGRVVDDSVAPAFTVLADVDGNEVCICTWQNRGQ